MGESLFGIVRELIILFEHALEQWIIAVKKLLNKASTTAIEGGEKIN